MASTVAAIYANEFDISVAQRTKIGYYINAAQPFVREARRPEHQRIASVFLDECASEALPRVLLAIEGASGRNSCCCTNYRRARY